MQLELARSLITHALETGRAANGYLIVGSTHGDAMRLAEMVLTHLFGHGVENRSHPDIHWVSPQKKSRLIDIEQVHARIVDALALQSFSGGWRAVVIVDADCLNTESSNAFLKTLEEPPKDTIFLLLTNSPDRLLPTIVSRCQRVDLPDAGVRTLLEPYKGDVISILSNAGRGRFARDCAAGRIVQVLEKLRGIATDEVNEQIGATDDGVGEEITKDDFEAMVSARYREYRGDLLCTMLEFFRKLLSVCATSNPSPIPLHAAMHNVELIEAAAVSFDRNMSEMPVMSNLFDLLTIPPPQENKD